MPRAELTPQDREYKKIISKNLNELLKLSNKKQIDIKRATGIPASTLTGYFKGTRLPSPLNVEKLAQFFNVLESDIDPRFKITDSTSGNKQIMATNIKRYLDKLDLNTKEFSAKLGFKYTTVLDWVNAKTYPRIDKIDKMANFFGIEKSELVEDYGSTYNWDCKELLDIFNQLNEQNKKRVIDYADSKLKEQGYTNWIW